MRRLAILAMISTSCAGLQTTTYYLPPLPEATGDAPPTTPAVSVSVQAFRVVPAYDTTQVTFRSAPAVLQRFSYREWAADPGWLFASLAARRLERHFPAVASPDAPAAAEVLVGGTVRVLEADYRTEGRVRLRLAVEFEVRPGDEAAPRSVLAEVTADGSDLAQAVAKLGPLYAAEVDRLAATIGALAPETQASGSVK